MEKWSAVAQVVAPIFAAVLMGIFARRKRLIAGSAVKGMQQYVMTFGLPCVIFNCCLNAAVDAQSMISFVMVMPVMVATSILALFVLKKRFPYHNMPMLFAAQESGMLGIPLYLTLFGAAHMFKIGVLDLAQALTCICMIAILSADAGENPRPLDIAFSDPDYGAFGSAAQSLRREGNGCRRRRGPCPFGNGSVYFPAGERADALQRWLQPVDLLRQSG